MSLKVNIIIPTFERVELFKLSIDSALNQSYKNIIVTVFDNSKSEKISSYVNKLRLENKYIEYIRNSINIGPYCNYRKILRKVKGDYFYIMCSDSILKSDAIENLLFFAKENIDLPLVFCKSADKYLNGEIVYTSDDYLKYKLTTKGTGVYETKPFLNYFLYAKKPQANINLFENLINTDFYLNSEVGLPTHGTNDEEYRLIMILLLSNKKIGYINKVLKYNIKENIVEETASWRSRVAVRKFNQLWVIENLLKNNERSLIINDVNLLKVKLRLILGYINLLLLFDIVSLYSGFRIIFYSLDLFFNFILYILIIPLKIFFALNNFFYKIIVFLNKKYKIKNFLRRFLK